MPIKVGDKLPNATFRVMTAEGPNKPKTTDEIFKGKKVALFAVPGAFTPTCNNMHLPSFLNNADAIKAKGVDTIAVTGVNDVFVMDAWKKATGADGKIEFLADGNGEFAKAHRHGLRRLRQRARHALEALLDAGRGRRGEEAQYRGRARQVRHLRRQTLLAQAASRFPVIRSSLRAFRDAVVTSTSSRQRAGARATRPSRASWSARSFMAWPAWPLTQCQRTSCWPERGVEPLPQIDVLDRLLVGGAPAVLLPAVDPAGDAAAHIFAVGVEIDRARALQGFQRRDRRHQFHAVVGGVRLAAVQFLFVVAERQDRAPAARPRIAGAGAVGVDRDALVRSSKARSA